MKLCPLCGQMFGSASIDIHVPQCHDKAVRRWEQLPPRERGPRPAMPVKRGAAMPSAMYGGGHEAGQQPAMMVPPRGHPATTAGPSLRTHGSA